MLDVRCWMFDVFPRKPSASFGDWRQVLPEPAGRMPALRSKLGFPAQLTHGHVSVLGPGRFTETSKENAALCGIGPGQFQERLSDLRPAIHGHGKHARQRARLVPELFTAR